MSYLYTLHYITYIYVARYEILVMHELNQFHATNFYRARSITFQHHLVTREMRPNTSRQLRRYYYVGTYFMYCRYILRYLHKRGVNFEVTTFIKKKLFCPLWSRVRQKIRQSEMVLMA